MNKRNDEILNTVTRHEDVWGSGGIVPRIPNLRFTSRSLYPWGKKPRYSLDRRLGEPQSRSGRGGEEKEFLTVPGIKHWSSSP